MAPGAAGSCISGVARELAPALKAISSLGELTGVHLQVYPSLRRRGGMENVRKVRCSKNEFS
jgi:hypothetical protein